MDMLALKREEILYQLSLLGHCVKSLFSDLINYVCWKHFSKQAFGFWNQSSFKYVKIAKIISWLITWALYFCKLLNPNTCFLFVRVQVSLGEQSYLLVSVPSDPGHGNMLPHHYKRGKGKPSKHFPLLLKTLFFKVKSYLLLSQGKVKRPRIYMNCWYLFGFAELRLI